MSHHSFIISVLKVLIHKQATNIFQLLSCIQSELKYYGDLFFLTGYFQLSIKNEN